MKNINKKLILTVLFTALYNLIFWQESLGVNILIFSVLLTGALLYLNKSSILYRPVQITVLTTFVTAIMILWHSSSAAKFAHIISLLVMTGFISQASLRSVYLAAASYFASVLSVPASLRKEFGKMEKTDIKVRLVLKRLQLSLVPLAILMVFYFIYHVANPVFKQLSNNFWFNIGDFFAFIFQDISFGRILFITFAFVLMAAAFYNQRPEKLVLIEMRLKDQLARTKRLIKKNESLRNMLGLRQEYYAAILLISATNLLLLIINIIDIQWIWFGFDKTDVSNLSQFVHEGTYMLILSILLSMVILLYYFRGNLNFFSQNNWLKKLAYLWIFQNGILVISVALRNYHYINEHGLAYKRIGVILFLMLVLYGLYTFYTKIKEKQTGWYLLRVNSWAVFMLFVLNSFVDWDMQIANYNISRKVDAIDTGFLLTLSDKTLPILNQHSRIFTKTGQSYYGEGYANLTEKDYLYMRIINFKKDWERKSWLSWNWAEHKAYQQLANPEPTAFRVVE